MGGTATGHHDAVIMLRMRRIQIRLTDDQVAALEASSAATRRSKAAVVRDAVELWRNVEDRRQRSDRARGAVGGFRSGLYDVSERHDEYLAQAFDEELSR
jgi:Arc/MetJ-type ribon-helix-helix transcriptional regulator